MGCNCEFYTEPGMLEIESLGSLARLEPGSTVEHKERWDIANADIGENEDDLDGFFHPIVEKIKS